MCYQCECGPQSSSLLVDLIQLKGFWCFFSCSGHPRQIRIGFSQKYFRSSLSHAWVFRFMPVVSCLCVALVYVCHQHYCDQFTGKWFWQSHQLYCNACGGRIPIVCAAAGGKKRQWIMKKRCPPLVKSLYISVFDAVALTSKCKTDLSSSFCFSAL